MDTLWMVSSQPVMVGGDPYVGMKHWFVAARQVRVGEALRPIDLERCATASELRVVLAVRGLVTATQGRAKEARLRWRRAVLRERDLRGPAETIVELRKAHAEHMKRLRRDARVARKLAHQAQRTLRAYTCAFWLARREDPRRKANLLDDLVRIAWNEVGAR